MTSDHSAVFLEVHESLLRISLGEICLRVGAFHSPSNVGRVISKISGLLAEASGDFRPGSAEPLS